MKVACFQQVCYEWVCCERGLFWMGTLQTTAREAISSMMKNNIQ